ncbi:3-ketosteroid 9alpha-monooxygenase subunit A [Rhodococcus rhodochrous J3]|uniref:3-ketosteroid-9-alpha-monooxygenase, oxygenase component n=2 Tax=Rhodococcus rhodochrous TaxID=1829 RepID=A0AA46WX54_RHORH|nr:Rieske 2Fe-2S domain-containing protein [Rhodococcus rhodochrous]AYA24999.1 3-ketosteroid-9-alpha-hydroxylase subunit A [Rhodococcus rhodochrous]MBF4477642.1 3-ketosteroid-9-alpha-hydroxylase subunit A [Rhodococcus rhodochrous]MCB8910926.1 3-ketosteroid-9-alpha-hydroxylase subunit A [Rhodococcus rhodochrous]MCD2098041.1 3-ketosteroid-9-alpha-hydroxylase subunit A [Rhodococcus rhodochrous]MCD2122167.1 3-ketosteroid-9-alpha-hydroxylase subunit A [Rhodococcus rhodochrous]
MSLGTSEQSEIREIVAGSAPARFARGWHCLGLSKDFKDGKPHSIEAFGTKLVVWADSNDEIKILDAYCRHMGGDLSQGTVKGDEIACPFHDWRWGGNGRCKKIPYARRVPPIAKTRAWHTLDQDGMLFVWHDPQGNPPPADVTIPRIEGATSDDWTDWVWYTTEVDTNCREIIDNIVDMAHFFYVHYSFPVYFKNVFEGQVASQFMRGQAREDTRPHATGQPKMLGSRSDASYFGPSFMIDDLVYQYEGYDVESVLINCHYPVSQDKFVLMYGMIVKKSDRLQGEEALQTAQQFGNFIAKGFEQDIEIWRNKTRIDNPLLCEEDGPVYQLRRWYEQFYVDVDDVKPEMTDRFEFEMDTTRPVAAWMKEVEGNLARKAALEEQAGTAEQSAAQQQSTTAG